MPINKKNTSELLRIARLTFTKSTAWNNVTLDQNVILKITNNDVTVDLIIIDGFNVQLQYMNVNTMT